MLEEQLAKSSGAKPPGCQRWSLQKTLLCQTKGFILWLRATEEDGEWLTRLHALTYLPTTRWRYSTVDAGWHKILHFKFNTTCAASINNSEPSAISVWCLQKNKLKLCESSPWTNISSTGPNSSDQSLCSNYIKPGVTGINPIQQS